MRDTIRFVRGAVSDRALAIPALSHFCIAKKRIQGANGSVAIDAPIDLEIEAVVHADRFLAAVDACDGEPKMRFTDGGRLVLERKPFRAMLPVLPLAEFPISEPSKGKRFKLKGSVIDTLKILLPFMGDDAAATHRWTSSLLFHEGAAYATNSAMMASLPCKTIDQSVELPHHAVDELIRIAETPEEYCFDETSITFFWKEGRWLRSQLLVEKWPIKMATELLKFKIKPAPLPPNLLASIKRIIPFCADPKFPVIFFKENGVSTAPGEVQAEINDYRLEASAFHAENLIPMLERIDRMTVENGVKAYCLGPNGFRGLMSCLNLK